MSAHGSLCLSLFLVTLESTIVSTSQMSIANALNNVKESGWINTAYLLTFTGFLVIIAKFSETLGQKLLLCSSQCLFVIFSLACGASNSMLNLSV